jgi:hypothetical protein
VGFDGARWSGSPHHVRQNGGRSRNDGISINSSYLKRFTPHFSRNFVAEADKFAFEKFTAAWHHAAQF